jgi:hypothetical protein
VIVVGSPIDRRLIAVLLALSCCGCPRTAEPGKDVRRAADLAAGWQPPAAGADVQFPAEAAGFKLASQDADAALKEFEFDRPGRHATYAAGEQKVEVFVFDRVGQPDLDALRKGIEADHALPGPEPRGLSFGTHWLYSSSRGQRYWVFPKGQWLAVFRASKAVDQVLVADAVLSGIGPRTP